MSLLRFLLLRLVKMAAVVLAIVVVNFLLIHAAPGDPASVIAGQSGAAGLVGPDDAAAGEDGEVPHIFA